MFLDTPTAAHPDIQPEESGGLEFPSRSPALLPSRLEIHVAAGEQQNDVLYHVYQPWCGASDAPCHLHRVYGLHLQFIGNQPVGTLEIVPCRNGRKTADRSAVVTSRFLLHGVRFMPHTMPFGGCVCSGCCKMVACGCLSSVPQKLPALRWCDRT